MAELHMKFDGENVQLKLTEGDGEVAVDLDEISRHKLLSYLEVIQGHSVRI